MLATAEMRWFYEGLLPAAVLDWFVVHEAEPARNDLYLKPTDEALNVKLRQGRLEVKRRDTEGGIMQLGPGIAGRLEHWHKWSFPLAAKSGHMSIPPGPWIRVRKTRLKQMYQLDTDGQLRPRSDEAPYVCRCSVECSRLEIEGHRWWSLCLEAFCRDRAGGMQTQEALLATADAIFSSDSSSETPALAAAHSYGYPAWLRQHRQDAAQ